MFGQNKTELEDTEELPAKPASPRSMLEPKEKVKSPALPSDDRKSDEEGQAADKPVPPKSSKSDSGSERKGSEAQD